MKREGERERDVILKLIFLQQLAKQEEFEKQERLNFHKDLYRKNLAEKSRQNYAKNYELCNQVIHQIVDFATKMVHYRELTQG